MTADPELGVCADQRHSVVEGGPPGHECGFGESAGRMQLDDSAVDAAGETEVVGIEYQAGGHPRLQSPAY